MWQCGLIIFVFLGVPEIESAEIPPFIKPCSKKHFSPCALKNGNEAIPFLLKGDPQFNIPNLLPLRYPIVDVKAGSNLKIKLTDIEVHGLDTVTLTELEVDFEKKKTSLSVDAKHLELFGNYDLDGQILIMPIKGNGKIKITADDSHFKYLFNFKLENREGIDYAIIMDDDKLEYKITKVHFQLDNLFNGNKAMGDNVNKFLNENGQEVLKELGGVIEETIKTVIKQVGGGVSANLPYRDLFLD